jgi:hypothetical protein
MPKKSSSIFWLRRFIKNVKTAKLNGCLAVSMPRGERLPKLKAGQVDLVMCIWHNSRRWTLSPITHPLFELSRALHNLLNSLSSEVAPKQVWMRQSDLERRARVLLADNLLRPLRQIQAPVHANHYLAMWPSPIDWKTMHPQREESQHLVMSLSAVFTWRTTILLPSHQHYLDLNSVWLLHCSLLPKHHLHDQTLASQLWRLLPRSHSYLDRIVSNL